MKNVTGYDLSKAMSGSWGTLAAITDVTFKVLPAAETEATLAIEGQLDEDACKAMALAMGSSAEVSSAAYIPENVSVRFSGDLAGAATLLRLEGFATSVEYRSGQLEKLLGGFGTTTLLDRETSRQVWREIRDVHPFTDNQERPLWRISVAPFEAHKMMMALRMQIPVNAYYDWQGGLIWLEMLDEPEVDLVRQTVKAHGGGHAMLARAASAIRAGEPVFEPQEPALAALSKRLKENFDPKGILNPGRMVEGV